MSLIACPDCGTMVSRSAKACPTCGASAKAVAKGRPSAAKGQVSRLGKILIGGAVAGVVAIAGISMVSQPSPQNDPKAAALDQQRREATMADVASLKAALRDPDSLTFEKILANADGSIVCIRYRARNGFGGMNRDQAVFADGSAKTSAVAWNRRCVRAGLYDTTDETLMIMKMLGR